MTASKLVGVGDIMLLHKEGELKRAALMFDNLCLAGGTVLRFLESLAYGAAKEEMAREIATHDWLVEHGILLPAPPEFGSEALAESLLNSILNEEMLTLRKQFVKDLNDQERKELTDGARYRMTRWAAIRLNKE